MPSLVLTIHRCADQIGGNCIELALGTHRILLDAGSPLDAADASPHTLVPATLDTSRPVDAVLISHPHQDHFGLLSGLPTDWPVWSGAPSRDLMRLTASILGRSLPQTLHSYTSSAPFDVGPFRVTPLLTDHSAFDAHMLLVDVGRQRLLYSGDFRRTGRKSVLVDRLIANPPKDIDLLLLEGTTLGRADAFPSEADLEQRFAEVFRQTPGRVFVSWSGQNIDRTVTIYRACKQTGRTLVLDLYTLDVLEQLSAHRDSLPRLGWPRVQGVVTAGLVRMYGDRARLNRPEFIETCCATGRCMSAAALQKRKNTVVMLRPTLLRDYQAKGLHLTSDDTWVFSQWSGYLTRAAYSDARQVFDAAGARFEHVHTSGHASRNNLLALAHSVDAQHLVPIHSFDWDDHAHAFPRVLRLRDGEPYNLGDSP